jgi:hypothetical protein
MEALIQLTRKNSSIEADVTHTSSFGSPHPSLRVRDSYDSISHLINRGKEIFINLRGTVRGPSLNFN